MDKTKASPTRPWLNAQLVTMLLPWGGLRSIAAGAKHLIDGAVPGVVCGAYGPTHLDIYRQRSLE
jgi:hypothetical protein